MKIAVYCASSTPENLNMKNKTIELGKYIAKNNHTLVFGGSNSGLMGLVSNSSLDNNGKVIGVVPNIDLILKRVHPNLTEVIYTKDMADRRTKMIELSDIFISLPGGPGTLDELSEVMDLIRIKELNKKLLIYNIDGFYDDLFKQVNKFYEYNLIKEHDLDNVYFVSSIEEINQILNQ